MPWVALHESGVAYDFWGQDTDACTLDDSVVTNDTTRSSTDYALPWGIYLYEAARLRLTTLGYEKLGGGTPSNAEEFEWNGGGSTQGNEASDPVNNFEPSPFEADLPAEDEIEFTPDTGNEGDPGLIQQVLIEVWADDPTPDDPPPTGKPYVIRQNHRAYAGADTAMTIWVRDEEGRHDLTQYSKIEVWVKRNTWDTPDLTVPATGTEYGELGFTITADDVSKGLAPGIFNLVFVADGSVIQIGFLEVV